MTRAAARTLLRSRRWAIARISVRLRWRPLPDRSRLGAVGAGVVIYSFQPARAFRKNIAAATEAAPPFGSMAFLNSASATRKFAIVLPIAISVLQCLRSVFAATPSILAMGSWGTPLATISLTIRRCGSVGCHGGRPSGRFAVTVPLPIGSTPLNGRSSGPSPRQPLTTSQSSARSLTIRGLTGKSSPAGRPIGENIVAAGLERRVA